MDHKAIRGGAYGILLTIAGVLIADVQKRAFVGFLIGATVVAILLIVATLPPVYWRWRKVLARHRRRPMDQLSTRVTRGSEDSVYPYGGSFCTEGRENQFYETGFRPSRLELRTKGLWSDKWTGTHIVREGDLPIDVPCRGGRLRISHFTPNGFVFSEVDTTGDEVLIGIYR